jgi:hypothetical protein
VAGQPGVQRLHADERRHHDVAGRTLSHLRRRWRRPAARR